MKPPSETAAADSKPWPLKSVTKEDLDAAHNLQDTSYQWNLSNEREFMENLFCQRFNFVLVFFSLFVAAAASANTQPKLTAILGLGALITTLTSLTIWRAYEKLVIIFTMLYRLKRHPITMVGDEHDAQPGYRRVFPVNSLIGRWIPLLCSLALILGFILSCTGHLKADPTSTNEFPRIGASYQLTYDKRPEGHYWPSEVKIIAKGDGQWYLVEYERTQHPLRRSIVKPASEATPTAQATPTPAPVVTIEQQWINFALILAVDENK